ncbi:MAG: DNA replication/repair protein RecF [Anaerolineales bacterium]|nr:DNA replication/repair protein RecF [Anaerolineales bacterium]
MRIDHLTLKFFRNYTRLELSIPEQVVVLHGSNAQGKTSLLEAIYYLATASSPYTNSDRQLMNWRTVDELQPFTQVAADVVSANNRFNRIEIILTKEKLLDGTERFKKDVRINGVTKRNLDLQGLVGVVMFLPQDLSLIEGSPAIRRRYLDLTLCQTNKLYSEAINTFDKALIQRNALLKRIGDGYASVNELTYWDEQLASAAGVIIAGRQQFIRELELLAQRIHRDLSGGLEDLELVYQPSFEPTAEGDGQQSFKVLGLDLHRQLTAEKVAPQYQAALADNRQEEVQRGVTLIGPQRDEMRLMVNGHDLGNFGSRGQARTGVMAIKLAELEWMHQTLGEWPILLLDEVVAELDIHRRGYLLERIEQANQVLLTTTELSTLTPDFVKRATLWKVEMGNIKPLAQSDVWTATQPDEERP